MVKTTIQAAAFLLASWLGIANAHPPPPDDVEEQITTGASSDDDPGFNMLGFRFTIGSLPMAHTRMMSFSLGLGVEHPVFKKTRVFGEYEWLWLVRPTPPEAMTTVPSREEHASGHRTLVGLRREIVAKRIGRGFSLYLDGELGGGLAIANENLRGVELLPTGFVGVRGGYDFYSHNDDSPSSTFEAEFLLRALAVPDGIGMLFGVGMHWGN